MVFAFELVEIDNAVDGPAANAGAGADPLRYRSWKLPEMKSIIEKWQNLLREEGFWNAYVQSTFFRPSLSGSALLPSTADLCTRDPQRVHRKPRSSTLCIALWKRYACVARTFCQTPRDHADDPLWHALCLPRRRNWHGQLLFELAD